MAITDSTHEALLKRAIARLVLGEFAVPLLIVDVINEEINQWIG